MEKEKKLNTIFKKEVENDEIEVNSVNDTPFNILLNKKTKVYKIVIGNQIASSKEFKSKEKAYKYIIDKPWELLTNMMFFTILKYNELKQEKND